MRKKIGATFLALSLLASGISPAAMADTKTEHIEQKKNDSEQKAKNAKDALQDVRAQKKSNEEMLLTLELQISRLEKEIHTLQTQIDATSAAAAQAAQEYKAASERVEKRDALLKSRVRAMYEADDMSYLDMLLSAENFSDLIERYSFLKLIGEQDAQILADNKRDRNIIEQKKKEIEQKLQSLTSMQAEKKKLSTSMQAQKKEREQVLAELEKKETHLEDMADSHMQAAAHLSEELRKQMELSFPGGAAGSGELTWPVPSVHAMTSPFGMRIHPITGKRKLHNGIDIGAPQGTPIVAAGNGQVVFAGKMNGYGNTVIIAHGGGRSTQYAHIRDGGIHVSTGQIVTAGQPIAEVGTTGNSTGPHLHFIVYENGQAVNPIPYLH